MKKLLKYLALLAAFATPALLMAAPAQLPGLMPRVLFGTAAKGPTGDLAASVGSPRYLGSYNATATAKTNAEVSTPFGTGTGLLKNKVLLVDNQGAVDIRILEVSTSTGDVTTTRDAAGFGVLVRAGSAVTLRMGPDLGYLSVITTSSTANVDVWELL